MKRSPLEIIFEALLKDEKIPKPAIEYRFLPDRKWRFDFAYPEKKIAVEIEGGVYSGGRHTRGSGFTEDTRKYNRAVMEGWKVLRYTAETMTEAPDQLRILLKNGN